LTESTELAVERLDATRPGWGELRKPLTRHGASQGRGDESDARHCGQR